MDSSGAARKRGRADTVNGNADLTGTKRTKVLVLSTRNLEMIKGGNLILEGILLFFILEHKGFDRNFLKISSTSGCQFGEGCHFLHFVPGGYNAVTQMTNSMGPTSLPDTRTPLIVKTRMCNNFNTPEGCKFGEKCRFAHGEKELGKHFGPGHQKPPEAPPAATFGASATAKISVDASLAGIIIGKSGVNTKHICRLSGVKLSIRDHESDPNLRNIELEGTFDQIKQASSMVRELIVSVGSTTTPSLPPRPAVPFASGGSGPASNYKTKLCEKFSKGSCTFGERCHFAHGASELH